MKKLALLFVFLPTLAWSQPASSSGSTRAQQEYANALTAAARFGIPRYTTALLPTCSTANKGAMAFDTTVGGVTTCNGTAWGIALTGGTITGTPGAELAPAIGAGTGWTCGAGWDCTVAGTLNKNAPGTGTVAPDPAIVAVVGSTYRVTTTVGAVTVAGGASCTLGGTALADPPTTVGVHESWVTAATTASLICTPTDATRFTITAVSVQLMSAGDLEVEGKLTVRRGIEVSPRTTPAPSITGPDADSGFGFVNGDPSTPAMISNSYPAAYASATTLVVPSMVDTGTLSVSGTVVTSPTTNILQLGPVDSATPVAQTLRSQGSRATVDTNVAGGNLTIFPGTGTGNAAGSTLALQAPIPVGSGTGAQTQTTFLGLNGTTGMNLYRTVTAAGTTGAQTINKPAGSVNFAAAATTLVVTNSFATTTSLIFLTPQTADATCESFAITRASGSFTITANAACTAETAVAFWVTN